MLQLRILDGCIAAIVPDVTRPHRYIRAVLLTGAIIWITAHGLDLLLLHGLLVLVFVRQLRVAEGLWVQALDTLLIA